MVLRVALHSIEIMEGLWQVGGDTLTAAEDAAVYLLSTGKEAVLIDAGCGRQPARLAENISHCLNDDVVVSHLLVTHCHFDHTGGAAAVRDTFGCRIVAHALDAVYLEKGDSGVTAASWYGARMEPLAVDVKLEGEQNTIAVEDLVITALHWPGHSPGSVVYTATLADRLVVFGQDVHGPIHPALLSDEERYQASLRKLLALDADLLLEGHFGIFEGKEAVRRFVRSFMR